MKARPLPSQEELLRLFDYDPEEGTLRWKINPRGGVKRGDLCGTSRKHHVRFFDKFWRVNRIIWKMMTGEDPPEQVNHRDTNPLNNKWENLRLASSSQNAMNKGAAPHNKLGVKGVHVNKDGCYTAQIRIRRPDQTTGRGKMTYLGRYNTLEDAKIVYAEAVRLHHGEFGRTNHEANADTNTTPAPTPKRRTRSRQG